MGRYVFDGGVWRAVRCGVVGLTDEFVGESIESAARFAQHFGAGG